MLPDLLPTLLYFSQVNAHGASIQYGRKIHPGSGDANRLLKAASPTNFPCSLGIPSGMPVDLTSSSQTDPRCLQVSSQSVPLTEASCWLCFGIGQKRFFPRFCPPARDRYDLCNGPVAQLGERRTGSAEVRGSSPLRSTTLKSLPRLVL